MLENIDESQGTLLDCVVERSSFIVIYKIQIGSRTKVARCQK